MPRIAISYRREDTSDYAARIAERLRASFGSDSVLIDFDEIQLGEDFVEAIEEAVGQSDIMIAVIGQRWAAGNDTADSSLDDETDPVRIAVETALEEKVKLIPVLVGGASMPPKESLPTSMAKIVRRQALKIADDRFEPDMEQLTSALERMLPAGAKAPAESEATKVIEAGGTQVIEVPKTTVVPSEASAAIDSDATTVMDSDATKVIGVDEATRVIGEEATALIESVDGPATVVIKEPKAFDWSNVNLLNLDSDAWVRVPGGTFTMGSTDGTDQEKPEHQVTVSSFVMARFPVTNEQWRLFVEATGTEPPRHWEDGSIPPGKERHPVVFVSWGEADAFCHWISKTIVSPTPGRVRLATEAEREFVVRGTGNRTYPWGNEKLTPRRANYAEQIGDTSPVDAHPDGATTDTGLYDLAGNVWEWCQDWFGNYPRGAVSDPTGPQTGESRVLRGGSYFDQGRYLRATARPGSGPKARLGFYGFRVVWSDRDQGETVEIEA